MKIVKVEANQSVTAIEAQDTIIKKGYSPYINSTTGTWMVYDDASKTWVDTGIKAKGEKGDDYVITEKDYDDIATIAAEKVDVPVTDVQVDNKSIVENKIAKLNSTDFGKVDDVKVNGTSVVTNKVAEVTVPTFDDTQMAAINSGISNTILNSIEKNILNNSKAIKTEEERATGVEDNIKKDVASCSLITETGNKVDLEIDTKTYELVAKLYDKNNNLISTSTTIDLPLETLVLNVEYDKDKKAIIITLKDGTTKEVPVGDLISGLVNEETFNAEVDRAKKAESELDTNKQNNITDLDTIRSGASAGATAVQDSSYVHTDNNFTTTYKDRLDTLTDDYIKGLIENGNEVKY